MAEPVDHNQPEPGDISVALDVEQLDLNLYRSRYLFQPYENRGVFGGQLISQALVAATKCVKPEFLLHSLHVRSSSNSIRKRQSQTMLPCDCKSYFLLSASASEPLLYYVDRLREGRSFSTRYVRAMQGGRAVFVMLCSFQVPEIWQPSRHWPMPQAPPPEDCEDEVERVRRAANRANVTEEFRARLLGYAKSQEDSPVTVKPAGIVTNESEGRSTYMYWLKAKTEKQYPAAFQRCILAYISDTYMVASAARIAGLKHGASPGPKTLAMFSSLDHSLFVYNNDFDCGDWLLYAITSPASGMGRGVASGLLYSAGGTLLAAVNQEGVIRANIPRPTKATAQVKAKM